MISRKSYELLAIFRLRSMKPPFDQQIDLQRASQLEKAGYPETREATVSKRRQNHNASHDFWLKITPSGEDVLEAFEDAERHANEERTNRNKDRLVQILIAILSFLGGIFAGNYFSDFISTFVGK